MRPAIRYLLLCIAGLVLPYSQLVPFLQEHGPDFGLFFQQLSSTRSGAFFAWDVIVSSVVLWVCDDLKATMDRYEAPEALNSAIPVWPG